MPKIEPMALSHFEPAQCTSRYHSKGETDAFHKYKEDSNCCCCCSSEEQIAEIYNEKSIEKQSKSDEQEVKEIMIAFESD